MRSRKAAAVILPFRLRGETYGRRSFDNAVPGKKVVVRYFDKPAHLGEAPQQPRTSFSRELSMRAKSRRDSGTKTARSCRV